jgi:hypothetical protein
MLRSATPTINGAITTGASARGAAASGFTRRLQAGSLR